MGTVQFDVCVRFLQEDPWERVRRVHQAAPHTRFRSLIRSKSIAAFDFLPDDINQLWVERLYANGFRVIGAFDGLNDVDNIVDQLKHGQGSSAPIPSARCLSAKARCTPTSITSRRPRR